MLSQVITLFTIVGQRPRSPSYQVILNGLNSVNFRVGRCNKSQNVGHTCIYVSVTMITKVRFTFGFQDCPRPRLASTLDGCEMEK